MGEHIFYFKGDKKAENIDEFREVLKEMSQDEFDHHVNNEKNDFATWIEHSLKNSELAQKVRKCKTIKETLQALKKSDKKPILKKVFNTQAKPKDKEHEDIIRSVLETKMQKELEPPRKKTELFGGEHHSLVIREFIFGILLGLFLGLILMAVFVKLGIYY